MYANVIFRPREGLKVLSDTESQWQPRASLVTHVWWHKALFHFQLGEFEQAITTFDDILLPSCKKGMYLLSYLLKINML